MLTCFGKKIKKSQVVPKDVIPVTQLNTVKSNQIVPIEQSPTSVSSSSSTVSSQQLQQLQHLYNEHTNLERPPSRNVHRYYTFTSSRYKLKSITE